MLLIIDNYDSFTYNLYQIFAAMGQEVHVVRNDAMSVPQLAALKPARLLISPGPGTPEEAGITVDAVRYFAGRIPVLGVCLGHQALAHAFGAMVVRAQRLMHGKTSEIYHDQQKLFVQLSNPFEATRYHSLLVEPSSLSKDFVVSAWTEQREIMGLRHQPTGAEGVQFHPESILTKQGPRLLEAFATC